MGPRCVRSRIGQPDTKSRSETKYGEGEAGWHRVRPTVLVADDNDLNRMVLARLLARWNVEVCEARNGLEAVERCGQGDIDLGFMDVRMPELDGFEATRRIRCMDTNRPTIVALTANAMKEDRDACLAAGMDDYLSKPFRPERLRDLIQQKRSHMSMGREGEEKSMRFDKTDLLERLAGDRELYVDTLCLFLDTSEQRRAEVAQAIERVELERLAVLCHTTKGVALTISAPRLKQYAEHLEQTAREGKDEEIGGLASAFLAEYDALVKLLRSELSAMRDQPGPR